MVIATVTVVVGIVIRVFIGDGCDLNPKVKDDLRSHQCKPAPEIAL